jgi:hypothetical protein
MTALTANERAARFYEKNKERVLEKKRIAYAAKKAKNNQPIQQPIQPAVDNEMESISEFIPAKSAKEKRRSVIKGINIKQRVKEPEPVEEINEDQPTKGTNDAPQPKPVKKNNKMSGNANPIMNEISRIINTFNDNQDNKDFRIVQMKLIVKVSSAKNYSDFIAIINTKPNEVVNKLKNYEYRPGKKYKNSSLLIYINTILYFLDRHETGITPNKKELYQDQNQILKNDSEEDSQQTKKANENKIPAFADYEKKVIETYGDKGKEYMITELYKDTGARDDLILKVVQNKNEVNGEHNFLVMNKSPNAIVILNKYKTIKKYGKKEDKMSVQVTNVLRDYLKNNKIGYGDYLFNNQGLSQIVSKMNKKMNFNGMGAINLFRKMLTTDVHKNKESTIQDKLALAKKLKHSLKTAKTSYNVSSERNTRSNQRKIAER